MAGLLGTLFHQPEVYQFDLTIGGQTNIGRFNVTMNDPGLISMQIVQHIADLLRIIQHLSLFEYAVLLQQLIQRLTGDQFHDQIGVAVHFKQFIIVGQPRMFKMAQHRKLITEGTDAGRIKRFFQRNMQVRLLDRPCFIHSTIHAMAQDAHNFIVANP
jgi:hypothetical protein